MRWVSRPPGSRCWSPPRCCPFPRRHLLALPVLRVHARVRGRRAPASARRRRGEPARRAGGVRLRGARRVDGAAPLRVPVRSGEFPRHAPRPARRGGDAGPELGIPGPPRRAVIALALLASYLAGSVPFGLLVARAAAGKDVRTVGSGNIGATNVARAAGREPAAITLLLDALKGLLPAAIAGRTLAEPWAEAA